MHLISFLAERHYKGHIKTMTFFLDLFYLLRTVLNGRMIKISFSGDKNTMLCIFPMPQIIIIRLGLGLMVLCLWLGLRLRLVLVSLQISMITGYTKMVILIALKE